MFLLRSCPRCCGDLYQDRDAFGYYLGCLQCGHEVALERRLEAGDSPIVATIVARGPLRADRLTILAERGSGRPGRYKKSLKVA